MSKSITIPSDRGSRITVNVNGREYTYTAGATVTVPDEVAEAIANSLALDPSGTRPSATDAMLADVTECIAKLNGDIAALDGEIDALGERMTAVDDPDTGAIAGLDTRVTALEEKEDTSGTGS